MVQQQRRIFVGSLKQVLKQATGIHFFLPISSFFTSRNILQTRCHDLCDGLPKKAQLLQNHDFDTLGLYLILAFNVWCFSPKQMLSTAFRRKGRQEEEEVG